MSVRLVDRLLGGGGLLRAHVARRPQQQAGHRQRGFLDALGQAEVGQPDHALGVQEEVGRLDVAVDDAALVRVRQRLRRLQAPAGNRARLQRGPLGPAFVQNRGQAFALDELHGVVVDAVLAADGEDGHDVRMVQAGDGLGLAPEALHRLGVGHGPEAQHLQGDLARQGKLLGLVDDTHAAAAHLAHDAKIPQPGRRGAVRPRRLVDELDAGQTLLQLGREGRVGRQ